MSLKRFTDEQLARLEQSLIEGRSAGVQFSLADVRSELQRRRPHVFDPRVVAATILEQAAASPTGFTSYGNLWTALSNGQKWGGNSTQSKMGRELANVLAYCHQKRLPILTVLVVQKDGKLSPKAIERICEECEGLGLTVGPDKAAFVAAQADAARKIVPSKLPSA